MFLYVNTGTAVLASEFNILLLHSSTTLSEFALFYMVHFEDGGTNSTLRIKEQGTHLTLHEHYVVQSKMFYFTKKILLLFYIT